MDKENFIAKETNSDILKKKNILREIDSLSEYLKKINNIQERRIIFSQIKNLQKVLEEIESNISKSSNNKALLNEFGKKNSLVKDSFQKNTQIKNLDAEHYFGTDLPPESASNLKSKEFLKKIKFTPVEKSIINRLKIKKKKISEKKEKKPNKYVKTSGSFFYNFSTLLLKKGIFQTLRKDIVKSNLRFIPATYLSMIFFTTILSAIVSLIISMFFLFFNVIAISPFIVKVEEILLDRVLKIICVFILIPVITFLFAYFYPSLERRSIENRINNELPFATIHMSSVSGSMIEPSKIFGIIIATKEYPYLEKEFIKLQNEINVYGYNLVTALKNRAFNSPSKKLAELFNGMVVTITSGGNLPEFLEKRSQSLLFDYRLEMEKQSKASETFMDIYISVVIAAPMILMLLLMMMSISGLGISLNPTMITLIMVLSVSLINVFFLVFLHLKQPRN